MTDDELKARVHALFNGKRTPPEPRTESAMFNVGWNLTPMVGEMCPVRFNWGDTDKIDEIVRLHSDAAVQVVVTWRPAP